MNYSNYAEYLPEKPKTLTYNVSCFNDMGNFNYTINGKSSFEIKNGFLSNFISNLYDKYIETYYVKHQNSITTQHFRLKKGLNTKWTHNVSHNNNIYTINVDYSGL